MLNGSIAQHASSEVVQEQEQQHVAREHQMVPLNLLPPAWLPESCWWKQMCMFEWQHVAHACFIWWWCRQEAGQHMWPGSTKWCP